MTFRILFVGPQWQGSDAAGLCRAFRALGCVVKDIDPDVFTPSGQSISVRIIRRLAAGIFHREAAAETLKYACLLRPHFALVYKGSEVMPETILSLKELGIPIFLVYPDVSMYGHGRYIPQCIPLYDWIFTTKSFGIGDLYHQFSIKNSEFLPHGFDSSIHRIIMVDNEILPQFGCDVSFIGTWSPKKEYYMTALRRYLPQVKLRIWGSQWGRIHDSDLLDCIERTDILGDLYPLAISCSTINIALLSEQRSGASSGDVSTSRTFYIPASGGFMLHERTDEVLNFFREGEEMACFASPDELADKTRYYLDHPDEREKIRLAGHQRATRDHSQELRAQKILERYMKLYNTDV